MGKFTSNTLTALRHGHHCVSKQSLRALSSATEEKRRVKNPQ
jgi:hypothetical protein